MKFKELRLTLFLIFLAIFALSFGVYKYLFDQSATHLWISIGMVFVVLLLLLTRMNIILYEDMLMNYRFIGIAFFPYLIEYKHILSIETKGRYCLSIIDHTQKRHHLYVFNSEKIERLLKEKLV